MTDLQFEAGKAARFFWTPDARPVSDPAPSVVFAAPISSTVELAPLRAAAAVTSVSSDGRVITFTDAVGDAAGLISEHGGSAWLDLGATYQGPVVIQALLTSTTAMLAAPLPFDTGTAGGSLAWNVWYADLTDEEVGAAVARRTAWSIDWTTDPGDDHPGEIRRSRGLVDVVRQRFDTGLGHRQFVESFTLFANTIPRGQSSWAPQIRAGMRELISRIEAKLDVTEFVDQLDGRQFQTAHALYTAHVIARSLRGATYDIEADFLAEAEIEFNRQFKRLRWLDANGDGNVDAGETDVRASSTGRSFGSPFRASTYKTFDGEASR